MCPTEANRAPQPARPRLGGRSAPAAGARLPDEAIPLAAALGAQPGGDPPPAPLPSIRIQAVTVRRMRRSVACLSVRQPPPAAPAREPVRPVPAPAALELGSSADKHTYPLGEEEESTMPKSRPPYPAAFRQQMVELVRSGRTPGELAREFEPSAEAIRNWVAQADRDAGSLLF